MHFEYLSAPPLSQMPERCELYASSGPINISCPQSIVIRMSKSLSLSIVPFLHSQIMGLFGGGVVRHFDPQLSWSPSLTPSLPLNLENSTANVAVGVNADIM